MRNKYIKLSCIKCKCEHVVLEKDIELFICEECKDNTALDLNRMAKLLEWFSSAKSKEVREIKVPTNYKSSSIEFYNEDVYQNVHELLFELSETLFKVKSKFLDINPNDFKESFQNCKIKRITTNIEKFFDLKFIDNNMIVVCFLDKHTSISDTCNYLKKVEEPMTNNELRFDIKYIEDFETQKVEIFKKL